MRALFARGAFSAGADLSQFNPFGSRRMLQIETPDAKFLRLRTSAHLCLSSGSKVCEALERIAQHAFLLHLERERWEANSSTRSQTLKPGRSVPGETQSTDHPHPQKE